MRARPVLTGPPKHHPSSWRHAISIDDANRRLPGKNRDYKSIAREIGFGWRCIDERNDRLRLIAIKAQSLLWY
jgi:hypothetical protein